jgi:hypothetical protein
LAVLVYFNLSKGVLAMPKRLIFIVGVLIGFLFGEVLRRKRMERLAWFEAAQAEIAAFNKQAEAELRAHYASLSTEEKINLAMRRAEWAETDPEAYAAWKEFEAGGFDDET